MKFSCTIVHVSGLLVGGLYRAGAERPSTSVAVCCLSNGCIIAVPLDPILETRYDGKVKDTLNLGQGATEFVFALSAAQTVQQLPGQMTSLHHSCSHQMMVQAEMMSQQILLSLGIGCPYVFLELIRPHGPFYVL